MINEDAARSAAYREVVREDAQRPEVVKVRMALARFTAGVFSDVGTKLHVVGHFAGTDRRDGLSPFGHGDDATVAVSMLLRIASQLVSGSADLIESGRGYAGAALIRQLVEIEYLAWAFETGDAESARWLRSDKKERMAFFTPAKLRAAAGGRFRSVDYGYHCELGGHPTPGSWALLNEDKAVAHLMLSDCMGHAGRIWDHIVGWAGERREREIVLLYREEMLMRFSDWKMRDPLTDLPPPPDNLVR